jgi:hypothetical protein
LAKPVLHYSTTGYALSKLSWQIGRFTKKFYKNYQKEVYSRWTVGNYSCIKIKKERKKQIFIGLLFFNLNILYTEHIINYFVLIWTLHWIPVYWVTVVFFLKYSKYMDFCDFMQKFLFSHLSLLCAKSWHLVSVQGSKAWYFSIGFI